MFEVFKSKAAVATLCLMVTFSVCEAKNLTCYVPCPLPPGDYKKTCGKCIVEKTNDRNGLKCNLTCEDCLFDKYKGKSKAKLKQLEEKSIQTARSKANAHFDLGECVYFTNNNGTLWKHKA